MAFLLALALVVSVMSGLGLSVSAEQESNTPGTEEVQQQDKTEAGAAPSEVKAEEEAAKPEGKPVQEEKADEQKTEAKENADKPAEKQEKATPKAGENVQTATIGTGDKTVTVKTTAAAGVLPEGAKLVVKKLADKDQAYQDAESTLKDSQVTYDDFLALDVGFEVNGKEVEPEAGSVQVQFELGAGLLPETADTSTLAVQHLTDGKAETVADAGAVTAGDVTVKNEVVKADFAVQSFSTFTITWGNSIKLTVFYVDEYGNDISATQGNVTINDNNMGTISLQQYAQTITGYNYKNARYKSYNGDVITDLNSSMKTKYTFWGSSYSVREIQFLNNGKTVSNSDWYTTEATIYLVYEEDENSGGGTGGVVTKPTPSYSKQANLRDDGTYDLSLTVSSNVGSASNPAKVDVIYVLDVSGSMKNAIKNGGKSKRKAANDAIESMTNSLANDKLINARFSLVTFSGDNGRGDETYNDARPLVQWTSNAGTLKSGLPGESNGGTNYEAGLIAAKDLLKSARKGATTVVIFISDGDPNFYYDSEGITDGPGSGYNQKSMTKAQAQVKELAATYFFKVGVGDPNNYKKLDDLTQNSLHAGTKTKPVFNGTDTDALTAAFEEMRGAITSISCTAVNITDTLQSDHAQIVKDANGTPTALRIVVTDGDGKEVKSGKGSVTLDGTKLNKVNVSTINAVYNENAKQIKLNFDPAYQLEENWTYAVIANIEPTAQAYEYYCNNKDYPDGEIGDAATGTHARESGFYCNTNAVLSYNDGEPGKTAIYAKPVIQVKPGTLKITKSFFGLDKEQITSANLSDNLTFTIVNGPNSQEVKLSEFKPGTDGTYTYEMPYCVPGATYTVTESNMDVEGFDCTTKVNGTTGTSDSATIEKDKTETIEFTNDYTLSAKNLTIKKEVVGDKPTSLNAKFDFQIRGPNKASGNYTTTDDQTVSFTDGVANITISGENSITIEKLPLGTYTVTETSMGNVDHYTWTTLENAKTGDATLSAGQDGTVTITNTLKKNPTVTIVKKITGNMSDPKDKFTFTYGDKQTVTLDGGDNSTAEIEVPYGSSFTVTESDKGGYTLESVSATNNQGTKIDDGWKIEKVTAPTTITFTNKKQITPPQRHHHHHRALRDHGRPRRWRRRVLRVQPPQTQSLMSAKNMEEIAGWLKELKFRKKIIGGVDEANVWHKLDELQAQYQSAFDAQAERYQALLDERDAEIRRLKGER